ncbi:MAG: pentapeptide repeat-containing protein [Gloeocapsa sp. DLM2.Bin57]|nr:MAG: pentapeptide repeat-containing protein [Gloeocapsa sp. DLM2.Bin57]
MSTSPNSDLETNNHQVTSPEPVKTPQPRESWYLPKLPLKTKIFRPNRSYSRLAILVLGLILMALGLSWKVAWIGLPGAIFSLLLSITIILPGLKAWLLTYLSPDERRTLAGFIGFIFALLGLFNYLGVYRIISGWLDTIKWDEFGSWAEWFGAFGQILIAVLAVYVAWEQYVISRDLTIQQNRITQQQTIDAYFQGVSELALNDEGLLEDWPQERAIAEGRTAAIMSSIDANGKAKVLRFLSQSRLIIPLKRDQQLGRPILDGLGNYAEDRANGIRVISLGVMLAGADLSSQDLRWTDLSEANMVRADLSKTDLVKANLSRTVLYDANLSGADLKSARFFYGSAETATPRSRKYPPNYETGAYTGAVVENADFSNVQNLNREQRYYICAWGGKLTRSTVPGGCEGIPNLLEGE